MAASCDGRPPPVALDFLLFLARVEKVVSAFDAEGLAESHDDAEIWRAKVKAYEAALRNQLDRWQDLTDAVAERYRSRIEEIAPSLERKLSDRRRQQEVAAAPAHQPAVQGIGAFDDPLDGSGAADLPDGGLQAPVSVGGDLISGSGSARDETDAISDSGPGRLGSFGAEATLWRRRGVGPAALRRQAGVADRAMLVQLEEEMASMSENMKGAASAFLVNLKRDDERLKSISSMQDKHLDDVKSETAKGKKLLWSSQLGFFCTMIMLATSVVMFCMMIPFIIFT
mmetsp:Transcript_50186/g.99170  ORF Transcript_50186/g.99170 Transcript_50186/m.99170 type:complete len:284 (+) Transcript_50186:88-939(+)